tara:strand:+ start:1111 stop:1527 length:417 start_codon:yes stop_codon:yes gene_type:complete
MDSPLKAEKYAFNKMLTRALQDINEESIPFGNDKEVVAAIDAVEAAFMRLKKAVFNSHAGQGLREHKLNEAQMGDGSLEGWAMQDDTVENTGPGEYTMYCDISNGQEELEYIVDRLRELYQLDGAVESINIVGDGFKI